MKQDKPITVTLPYLPPRSVFDKYIDEIWENVYLTNQGPLHNRFEDKIAEFLEADNVTLTVNGHMALDIALKGLSIQGEVITTPFTFASTTHVLTLNRITPIWGDIRESDLTLDPDLIESLITEKTTAIMPVHVYGHLCDIKRIGAIAQKYNLKVIYDAAHAFGESYDGRSVAHCGDVSAFSFHATKLFNSIEGGALTYADTNLKRIFDAYKNFGIEDEEQIDFVGCNAKMNEFQAAMGLAVLPDVPVLIRKRREITLRYREMLSGIEGVRYFAPEEEDPKLSYNYAYFPVLINENTFGVSRNAVYDYLKQNSILTRKYFYPLISDYGCYKNPYQQWHFPVASRISEEVLCLPIYHSLDLDDVDRIVSLLCKCGNNRKISSAY